ncbi:Rtr1/RPAP2 family-domain-containing protein [Parachaetomium inaequale]|uniref:RNA polymerase II subunit B1 CTD phosphatase RPAP2 homolog n=1 Tax=Parachaetomium inaequale TaxID=2588326 RepID=A0AAN6SNZ3_9PEZI|nr:Rtr1/RPAP2 family-domain-containing protein [Parachaetomium inaequale]
MATKPPPAHSSRPKGILKQPTFDRPPSPPTEPELTRAERLAQQEHAARLRLLQKLRDTQLKPPVPLETFERLSQLPSHNSSSASSPSAADTATFLSALSDFTPAEYLDLIEERNCLGKCGYTLCPRPRRTLAGPFKISSSSNNIARTADLNKWCSDACARRALHLKVQLDNPSYIRDEKNGVAGGMVVKLELRDEGGGHNGDGTAATKDTNNTNKGMSKTMVEGLNPPRGSAQDRNELALAMAKLEIDRHRHAQKTGGASALAGERGDAAEGVLAGMSRVDVTIKESEVEGPVTAPEPGPEGSEYTIEGYRPRLLGPGTGTGTGTSKKPEEGDESDDDDDFFTVRF